MAVLVASINDHNWSWEQHEFKALERAVSIGAQELVYCFTMFIHMSIRLVFVKLDET